MDNDDLKILLSDFFDSVMERESKIFHREKVSNDLEFIEKWIDDWAKDQL